MNAIAKKISLLTLIVAGLSFATPAFAAPATGGQIRRHQMAKHIIKTRAQQFGRGVAKVFNATVGKPLRYVINNPGKTLAVAVPTALATAAAVSPEFREAAVHAMQAGWDVVKIPAQFVAAQIRSAPVTSTAIAGTLGALAGGISWGTKGYNRGLKAGKGEAAPIK